MMPDMEKVIKALETCRKTDCANCEYNTEVCLIDEIISDALELLKEQRKQKFFVDAEGKITPLPIVFQNGPLKEQEAKIGHWIDTTKVIGFPRVECSVCGSGQGAIWMNYCPNCGAKMEG